MIFEMKKYCINELWHDFFLVELSVIGVAGDVVLGNFVERITGEVVTWCNIDFFWKNDFCWHIFVYFMKNIYVFMQKLNLLCIFESTDVDQSLGAGVGEGVAQATQVGVQRVQIILEAHVVAGGKSGVGESLTRSPIGCIGNSFGRPSQIRVTYKFTGKKKIGRKFIERCDFDGFVK